MRFWIDNDSRSRFVDIGLENIAVAAARVEGAPSRCSNKGGKNVDVYKTTAKNFFLD